MRGGCEVNNVDRIFFFFFRFFFSVFFLSRQSVPARQDRGRTLRRCHGNDPVPLSPLGIDASLLSLIFPSLSFQFVVAPAVA